MIDKNRKAFRDEDFNSNTDPKDIKYYVGEKFDQAGLPNPYIEDHDQVDQDNDDRDGRGLPANFAVSTQVAGDTEATDTTPGADSATADEQE